MVKKIKRNPYLMFLTDKKTKKRVTKIVYAKSKREAWTKINPSKYTIKGASLNIVNWR